MPCPPRPLVAVLLQFDFAPALIRPRAGHPTRSSSAQGELARAGAQGLECMRLRKLLIEPTVGVTSPVHPARSYPQ